MNFITVAIISQIMIWLASVLFLVAFFFIIPAAKHLFSKNFEEEHIKKEIFVLFSFGIGFFAVAFALRNVFEVVGVIVNLGAYLLLAGYLCFTIAFFIFWHSTGEFHQLSRKEKVFMFNTIAAVVIWLYLFLIYSVAPKAVNLPSLSEFGAFFYPFAVALMFISTLVVHPRLKAGIIRTPIWYISSGAFFYFLYFALMSYAVWQEVSGVIQIAYSFLLFVSSFYFALGAFAAKRKFKQPTVIHHHVIKKLIRSVDE